MAKVSGHGTIVQMEKDKPKSKCRTWQLRVHVGLDPRTGTYKTRTRVFHGTYTEAKKALRMFITEVEGDHVQGHTDWTFEAFCDHYMEMRKARGDLAPTTVDRLANQLRAACRHIGKAKLENVTPTMLNEMYVAMMKGDTLSGEPSGGCYVNQIGGAVYQVYELAKTEGLVAVNPCDRDTRPAYDVKPKEAVRPAKAKEFVESLDPENPHHMAFMLAVTLGLRRGEICGLSWGDIDWEQHTVTVRHSYDRKGNLKAPKTQAGVRILPIPDVTLDALGMWKEAQKKKFASINKSRWYDWDREKIEFLEQGEETPVITGYRGDRLKPDTLSWWWTHEREDFGLGEFTLHGLRHTYLSLLAFEGVHPKVMQELAGHASSQVTMDIYTHVNMDSKRAAAKAISEYF